MQARSALFDLYGDHLRTRGGRAPVAALVRMLAPLDIGAPAVRTAVSRMVRQGWLTPARLVSGPGYRITAKAERRLDEAAARIYRTDVPAWDGAFDMIVADAGIPRTDRARIASALAYLGYGRVGDGTWIAARSSPEADAVLAESGLRFDRFTALHTGGPRAASAMVSRAWDLDRIGREYREFVRDQAHLVDRVDAAGDPRVAFTARFRLPAELLPAHWPGIRAAEFFDSHAARLRPAADLFVDRCLSTPGSADDESPRSPEPTVRTA
jgi:phenylacetic acid degradation operon negative regulatory protein